MHSSLFIMSVAVPARRQFQGQGQVDAYFTKPEVIDECVRSLTQVLPRDSQYIDFSAGLNQFAEQLGLPYVSYDIRAYEGAVGQVVVQDWLQLPSLPASIGGAPLGDNLCAGFNPPFGYRHALVNRFVAKAASFGVRWLCLLCPVAYEMLARERSWYEEVSSVSLSHEAFYLPESGQGFAYPCKFCVYRRRQAARPRGTCRPPADPRYRLTRVYTEEQVPKSDRALLVRIVGSKAGRSHFECSPDGSLTHWRAGVQDKRFASWSATGIADKRYDAIELLDPSVDRAVFRAALLEAWRAERPDAFLTAGGVNFSIGRSLLTRLIGRCLYPPAGSESLETTANSSVVAESLAETRELC